MAKRDVGARVGLRIRSLRASRSMTQEALAERAGISWHFVSALERGAKNATLETLAALAAALDVSLSELFLEVDRPLPRETARLTAALAGRPPEVQRAVLRVVDAALALESTRPRL